MKSKMRVEAEGAFLFADMYCQKLIIKE